MRFLLLLLPNIYDIFTALAIGYAYFVDKETPLKIPFLVACVVIYMATRLGIFAGQIIGMLSGQVNDEQADVNDADAFAKKLIWGFVPQLIGVIIFQVIMAFCYLPNIFGAPKAEQKQAQQVQMYDKNAVTAEEPAPAVTEEAPAVAETESAAKVEDKEVAEQKVEPAIKEEPKYTAKVAPVSRKPRNIGVIKTSAQPKAVKEEVVHNPAPVTTVRYDIPERTLRIAGVEKSELNTANVRPVNTVSVQTTTSASGWSFSANTSAGTAPQTNTAVQNASSTYGSATQPKRYPGDDNPINTSWGYYRTGKWAADAARTLNNK